MESLPLAAQLVEEALQKAFALPTLEASATAIDAGAGGRVAFGICLSLVHREGGLRAAIYDYIVAGTSRAGYGSSLVNWRTVGATRSQRDMALPGKRPVYLPMNSS